jgi:hypothetical protein
MVALHIGQLQRRTAEGKMHEILRGAGELDMQVKGMAATASQERAVELSML